MTFPARLLQPSSRSFPGRATGQATQPFIPAKRRGRPASTVHLSGCCLDCSTVAAMALLSDFNSPLTSDHSASNLFLSSLYFFVFFRTACLTSFIHPPTQNFLLIFSCSHSVLCTLFFLSYSLPHFLQFHHLLSFHLHRIPPPVSPPLCFFLLHLDLFLSLSPPPLSLFLSLDFLTIPLPLWYELCWMK